MPQHHNLVYLPKFLCLRDNSDLNHDLLGSPKASKHMHSRSLSSMGKQAYGNIHKTGYKSSNDTLGF